MTEDLEDRIAAVLARITGETVTRRGAPLDLDSLAHAELVFALEETFRVRLPDQVSLSNVREASEAVAGARETPVAVPPAPLRERIGHLQWLGAGALAPILGPYFRLEVAGREHVPPTGPVVLASNHESLLDIPFLAIASPRRVWFMAKHELFGGRVGAWFFHVLGGFPVDRDRSDVSAVRAAFAVLARGIALGMYPEATRNTEFLPFRGGAAWVALATGAPLVPVGVRGTAEAMPSGAAFPRRSRVRVAFGEPMMPGREEDPKVRLERAGAVTGALRREVDRLRR